MFNKNKNNKRFRLPFRVEKRLQVVVGIFLLGGLLAGLGFYFYYTRKNANAASIAYGNGLVELNKKYVQGSTESSTISSISGGPVIVRLKYNNTANQSTTGTTISDTLPSGFTYTTGSIKNCYADGACVTLSDTLVSGNNIQVAPLSGYYGYSTNATTTNLELGRKRYVKLQTDDISSTAYSDVTCNLRADNNAAFGSPSFCGGSDEYKDSMNIDILGSRYIKLQTDDKSGDVYSERTCNLRADNNAAFGSPVFCDNRNNRLESMVTDILGNRYLKLQTDSLSSVINSERTCNLRSDNSPAFGTPVFCTGRDTSTFQMTTDLYDGARGYGYIEYEMRSGSTQTGITGTSATMAGSFGSVTDNTSNTIDLIDCTYKYPSNWILNVTLNDAELRTDQDFTCNYNPKICPHVFVDIDANGIQGSGEANVSGQTINLYRADGTTLVSTLVTDSGGNVCFDSIAGGATVYNITNPNPLTAFNSTGGDTQQATIASNDATTIIRFGYTSGSLSLTVPPSVTFPTKSTSSKTETSCTDINPIEVIDTRIGQPGWSVTAVVEDFVVDNSTLTLRVADKFTGTPGSVTTVIGASGPQAGNAKTVTSTTDPFTVITAGSGDGRGTYRINEGICQQLDPYTPTAAYHTVITFTII
jgi:SdrD B-like domain